MVEIPLRAKYRSAARGRYKSGYNGGSGKTGGKRKKVGQAKHVAMYGPQRERAVWFVGNKRKLIDVADLDVALARYELFGITQ